MRLLEFAEFDQSMPLSYGNPSSHQKEILDQKSELKDQFMQNGMYLKWLSEAPPDINSEKVRDSILYCIDLIQNVSQEDKEFALKAEENMYKIIHDFLKEKAINDYSLEDIMAQEKRLDPIIMGIKYYFNYPRPFQAAHYLNLPLYPIVEPMTTTNSPSYPSGHSMESNILCGVLAKKYPAIGNELLELADKISRSRVWAGIHYDFDDAQGRKIANDILKSGFTF
jgi:hypothetical protein